MDCRCSGVRACPRPAGGLGGNGGGPPRPCASPKVVTAASMVIASNQRRPFMVSPGAHAGRIPDVARSDAPEPWDVKNAWDDRYLRLIRARTCGGGARADAGTRSNSTESIVITIDP